MCVEIRDWEDRDPGQGLVFDFSEALPTVWQHALPCLLQRVLVLSQQPATGYRPSGHQVCQQQEQAGVYIV